jgi:hypothetical protein
MELNISSSRRTDSTLITDEEGLKKISNILNDHKKLNIDFGNEKNLEVQPNSIKKIFSLNEIDNPEENILFAFRTRNSNNSQNVNENNNIYEEDSFIENLKNNNNQNNMQNNNNNFETEDYLIKTNEKINKDNLNNDEKDIDENIINSMKNKSFFENHINTFKKIWEYSYYSLIIFSLINVLYSFIYGINVGFFNFFMILNNIGNILLFLSGGTGIYKIKIKKINKINESNLNIILISSLLTNLFTIVYIFYEGTNFLFTQSYFLYFQILSILNQSLTLILNFKMNQFYIEYNYLLPLKYPLLSNEV